MKAVACFLGFLLLIKLLPGLIIAGVIYFLVYLFFGAIYTGIKEGFGDNRGSGSSSDEAGSGWSGTGNPHV